MKWLVSALGFALLLSSDAAAAGTGQNILLLILDDVGTELIDSYEEAERGDLRKVTPYIDSLADGGVRFRNAYAYPHCSPTRASILTGRYRFANGVAGSWLTRKDIPFLPAFLPPEYRTAVIGKWHLSGKTPEFFQKDQKAVRRAVRHPVDFAGFESYSGNPANFRSEEGVGWLDDYYGWTKFMASRGDDGFGKRRIACDPDREDDCYITSVAVDDAIERIRAFGDAPWFLWVGFNAIHVPTVTHRPPARLLDNTYADWTDENERRKAHLEAADEEIGRLLAAISGTNTAVILLGDNGIDLGRHEGSPICKKSLNECGIRVPLFIKRPGMPAGVHEARAIVNTTDLFETIIELATGASVSGAADSPDSESLVPYLNDPTRLTADRASTGGPYVYAEEFATRKDAVDAQRVLRGDKARKPDWHDNYKLVQVRSDVAPNGPRLEEQLYALGSGPVPRASENLLRDRDNDGVPDVELSPGARKALEDLRAAMKLLQDRDGDAVDYRLDNCVESGQATREDCGGYEGAPYPCFCDTDADGIGNVCDCDFDNDGVCSREDFEYLQRHVDQRVTPSGPGDPDTDMNCDGVVGVPDVDLWKASAPEPGPSGLWCANARRARSDPACRPPGL